MASSGKFVDPAKGTDSLYSPTIFSYGILKEFRPRVFPKPRFGFDFRATYCFGLHAMSPTVRGITGDYELESPVKANMININQSSFWQAEMNIVFNPKKAASKTERGGIFLKGNFYKSIHNVDGFFAFFIGYSTDIKNFFQ